jgi:hypothetical protein
VRPEAVPLENGGVSTFPVISPRTDAWQVVRGHTRQENGQLCVDNDGGTFWIASKDDLPDDFQLVMTCAVEFLQGRQQIYRSQESIFRTLYIRFGVADAGPDSTDRRGVLIQLSQEALYVWKDRRLLCASARGSPEGTFVLTITKAGGDLTVALDGTMLFCQRDDRPLAGGLSRLSIGGCLSRLLLREIAVLNLGDKGATQAVAQPAPLRERAPPAADPPTLVDFEPPQLDGDRVERRLSSPVADAAVGSGGRYLVLALPKERRLAVFDVSAGRVVRYLPTGGEQVKFAAGLDKVVVVKPRARTIERWHLPTGVRELSAKLPVNWPVGLVVMGSASRGPVLLGAGNGPQRSEIVFVDGLTLQPLDIKLTGPTQIRLTPDLRARASADGTVFGFWHAGQDQAQGVQTLVLTGTEARGFSSPADATRLGLAHSIPGPDGRVMYTARGTYTHDAQPLGPTELDRPFCLPACHGPYYLTFQLARSPRDTNLGNRLSLHLVGNEQPLCELDKELLANIDPWNRGDLTLDKRIHLIPAAKVLITLPKTNDRVVLHRFDPEEALENSGIDYLFVTSLPPSAARRGAIYRYQVSAKSRRGGLQYRLASGPQGMEVSNSGQVTWAVPTTFAKSETDVVLTVTDAAQQRSTHAFTIVTRD